MGRKKRKGIELKPFCFYCNREFDDEKVLIQHQRAKHFKCFECTRKLDTANGLVVHMLHVHKETITKVPNALAGRENPEVIVHGMDGVPQDLLRERQQKLLEERGVAKHLKSAHTMFGMGLLGKPGVPGGGMPPAFPSMPGAMPGMPSGFPPMGGVPPTAFRPPGGMPMMMPPGAGRMMPPGFPGMMMGMPGGAMPPFGPNNHPMMFGMPPFGGLARPPQLPAAMGRESYQGGGGEGAVADGGGEGKGPAAGEDEKAGSGGPAGSATINLVWQEDEISMEERRAELPNHVSAIAAAISASAG